ncbi:MAG: SDR family oxidoreductase [Faecalibacillus sp.]
MSIIADVSIDEKCYAMIDKVVEVYSSIDVSINNADICPICLLDDITTEIFEKTMKINLFSVFMYSKYTCSLESCFKGRCL